MVLLVTTSTIFTALRSLSPSARKRLDLPETTPEIGAPISHEQLISLGRAFSGSNTNEADDQENNNDSTRQRQKDKETYTLNSLLRGTKVYIPPAPPKPEPSPEYLARKARLQALAEEQAYNALLAPSSSYLNPYRPSPIFADTSPGSNNADLINSHDEEDLDAISPSLVINVFMSILLCGFATFWALKNFQTPSFLSRVFLLGTASAASTAGPSNTAANSKDPVFVLISMFVGLLVGVAETVVYAAYLRKVKEAKREEKKIKERKEVIASSALRSGEKDATEDTGTDPSIIDGTDREEVKIWGKGVNGGVRRRVRERWQIVNEDSTEN